MSSITQKNVEELIRLADNGDEEAMLKLGEYYWGSGASYDACRDALVWYDKLADDFGNLDGIMRSMSLHPIKAMVNQSLSVGDFEEALHSWEITMDRANAFFDLYESIPNEENPFDQDDYALAMESLHDSIYGVGYCYFELKRFDRAASMLDILLDDDEKAKVLYGLSLFRMAKSVREYEGTYDYLRVLETKAYLNKIDGENDERILAQAATVLSGLYRLGIEGKLKPDINRAVDILQLSIANIKDDDRKQLPRSELSKYKKRAFGGYKYIENSAGDK